VSYFVNNIALRITNLPENCGSVALLARSKRSAKGRGQADVEDIGFSEISGARPS